MEAYTCGERQTDSREDYQLYDRIWQRVSPELNPYPNIRAEQGAQGTGGPAPQMESPVAPVPLAPPAAGGQSSSAAPAAPEGTNLPGAFPDPCCMGTAAQQSLGVLQGFLDEENHQRARGVQPAGAPLPCAPGAVLAAAAPGELPRRDLRPV